MYSGFPSSSAGKESACRLGDPSSIPGLGRSPGEGVRLPTPVFLDFPGGSAGKESTCNMGDLCSIPGGGKIPRLGRSPGEGNGYPLRGLYRPWAAKSQSQLSDFHSLISLSWLDKFQKLLLDFDTWKMVLWETVSKIQDFTNGLKLFCPSNKIHKA